MNVGAQARDLFEVELEAHASAYPEPNVIGFIEDEQHRMPGDDRVIPWGHDLERGATSVEHDHANRSLPLLIEAEVIRCDVAGIEDQRRVAVGKVRVARQVVASRIIVRDDRSRDRSRWSGDLNRNHHGLDVAKFMALFGPSRLKTKYLPPELGPDK